MEFGQILKELRSSRGLGIKSLAPDLGVTYSYLSKLENSQSRPSDDFVGRVASYFAYDKDTLLLAASYVPPELMNILREHPDEAVRLLRERFGTPNADSRSS